MYSIDYLEVVVKKDIPALPKSHKSAIKRAIEERLSVDPISYGKPLRYSLKGHRRLRVDDYRIVYKIVESTKKIIVTAIKHRREVYE